MTMAVLHKRTGLLKNRNRKTHHQTCRSSVVISLIQKYLQNWNKQESGAGGEVQLTDAMAKTMDRVEFRGLRFEGHRYDCGSKLGFIEANLAFALARDDLRDGVTDIIKRLSV